MPVKMTMQFMVILKDMLNIQNKLLLTTQIQMTLDIIRTILKKKPSNTKVYLKTMSYLLISTLMGAMTRNMTIKVMRKVMVVGDKTTMMRSQ